MVVNSGGPAPLRLVRRPGRAKLPETTKTSSRGWRRTIAWWPLLLGPAAIGIAVLLGAFQWEFTFYTLGAIGEEQDEYGLITILWNYDRLAPALESIAHWVLLVPAAIYWIRSIHTRNPLYLILTGLAASLLCREIHFTGMDKAIYPLGVIILVWVAAWRDLIAKPLKDRRHTIWLVAAVVTYIFAQLADRRVFKFIPNEDQIHSQIEECVETMGHLVLIVASLVGSWRRYNWPSRGPAGADKG